MNQVLRRGLNMAGVLGWVIEGVIVVPQVQAIFHQFMTALAFLGASIIMLAITIGEWERP